MPFEPVKDPVATFELEVPIQAFGTEIRAIAIKSPTAGDVFRVGNPVTKFSFDDSSVQFDETKAMRMLSALSNIPIEGSLDKMTSNDAISCFYGMARFFIPGLRSKPTPALSESSTKPDAQPAS